MWKLQNLRNRFNPCWIHHLKFLTKPLYTWIETQNLCFFWTNRLLPADINFASFGSLISNALYVAKKKIKFWTTPVKQVFRCRAVIVIYWVRCRGSSQGLNCLWLAFDCYLVMYYTVRYLEVAYVRTRQREHRVFRKFYPSTLYIQLGTIEVLRNQEGGVGQMIML